MFPTLMHSFLIFATLLLFSSADGLPLVSDCGSGLTHNFYKDTCPGAEDAISAAVAKAVAGNKGLCAGVIRLHFHDAFVRGSDASVLLIKDAKGNQNTERTARPNGSLRGFEVIDAAKAAVEKNCSKRSCPNGGCPPVVSCADVLAFAARDCVMILGNFTYSVPAGRLDGKISREDEASANLPAPTLGITQLQKSFSSKGLSLKDLVLLSAGHSVGISHCSSFTDRITDPINTTIINKDYAQGLKSKCTSNGFIVPSNTVPQDHVTPDKLDNQWYQNNNNNEVLFFSDWSLRDNQQTQNFMDEYANNAILWQFDFGCAMQKMGRIIELAPGQGEIREICSRVN